MMVWLGGDMGIFKEKKPLIVVFSALLAAPVFAGEAAGDRIGLSDAPVQVDLALRCRFEAECFETESCAMTTFAPALDGMAGGVDAASVMVAKVVMSSDAGDVDLLGVRDGAALWLSGGDADARHMVTIGADGAARYTVHYSQGPMMISYAGQCGAGE